MDSLRMRVAKGCIAACVLIFCVFFASTLLACSSTKATVNFEDSKYHNAVCEYIESKILSEWSEAKYHEGFQPFCAYWALGSDDNYVYVVFGGSDFIFLDGEGVARANACVIPARLKYSMDASGFRILAHDFPRNGSDYSEDMIKLFPQSARDKLDELYTDYETLDEEAYKRACEKLGVEYVKGSCIDYIFEERTAGNDD